MPPTSTSTPPLLRRIFHHLPIKLLMLALIPPALSLSYYLPQWYPLRTPVSLPLLWIDRAVPFSTAWIWPYMSMYLMLPLPPMFAWRIDHLKRYSIGMALMFTIACLFFFLLPISYPRPPRPLDADPLYTQITSIDQPINSLPSLHAGMTVFAILYAAKVFADQPAPRRQIILGTLTLWSAIILYGTLATKQHYFVDLPTGALLACCAHRLAWQAPHIATFPLHST